MNKTTYLKKLKNIETQQKELHTQKDKLVNDYLKHSKFKEGENVILNPTPYKGRNKYLLNQNKTQNKAKGIITTILKISIDTKGLFVYTCSWRDKEGFLWCFNENELKKI